MRNKSTDKVYEVSFHLIPTMDADGALVAFERVKKVVSERGKVLSEEHPVLRDLAYTIRHTVRQRDGTYDRYDEAHFCSVKFSAPRDSVKQVEQVLSGDDEVLRFLLLETSAEDTRLGEVLPGDEEEKSSGVEDASSDAVEGRQKEGESSATDHSDEKSDAE